MSSGKRRLAVAGIFVLLAFTGAGAAGAEHVVMPFQCKVERGRVFLTPATERSYEIVGPRRQQPFLYCHEAGRDRCRLRMLHRFDIACAGARVSWMAVAAAAARHAGRDACP